jgi:hypothetical protein
MAALMLLLVYPRIVSSTYCSISCELLVCFEKGYALLLEVAVSPEFLVATIQLKTIDTLSIFMRWLCAMTSRIH